MADSNDGISMLASGDAAKQLIQDFVAHLHDPSDQLPSQPHVSDSHVLSVAIAALDAFLQANVTGPVLPEESARAVERQYATTWGEKRSGGDIVTLRRACLKHLEVDGVSPYAHIPYLELFGLARYAVTQTLRDAQDIVDVSSSKHSLAWTRMRINTWHYKLLTQPSLGHGSNFTKSSQWSDVPTLADRIIDGLEAVSSRLLGGDSSDVWAAGSDQDIWTEQDKVLFLVEAANTYILLGRNDLAKTTLQKATQASGLSYALSGALGKRTRFQEKSISQLVVLARSKINESSPAAGAEEEEKPAPRPDALLLNNDTLLEEIQFTSEKNGDEPKPEELPPTLTDLTPDDQPQLSPLDQIILLTEATLKDAFSPIDTLTSEEILPYAVRVLADKSTNWQIYTQALLVRSRIEVHRSRTVERGVLQLQAVADQVLTDTTAPSSSSSPSPPENSDIPAIQVSTPDRTAAAPAAAKPTSFLPATKPSESAPAHSRLQYIHALSAPPRWHLESELAYAWAGVGSLTSALEIFKRLRLWAEVALCFASADALDDDDGRGSGGEEKAKGIIRWRLFHKTGTAIAAPDTSDADDAGADADLGDSDVADLRASDFSGPERNPPPANAARLWCILGDLESEPAHYSRAWDISNRRYSRAQKSLGEYYLSQKDWTQARLAYRKATTANRLNTDMWSRLGDINLRLGAFEEAAEAFSRAIGSATEETGGEGARTWSNLGSALWSRYCEVTVESGDKPSEEQDAQLTSSEGEDESPSAAAKAAATPDPSKLLVQSLAAYKKGASIAHDNWRIWDNVLTLSSRMRPPAISDIILSLSHILRIRKSEDAVDADMLSSLLADVVLSSDVPITEAGIREPARGTVERLVCRLIEESVVPLITNRSELWALVARLRAWKRDYAAAIDAAERAWRAATGSNAGLAPGATSSATGDWTADKTAWGTVVLRTDELASLLENYGLDVAAIGPKWKGKVRSAVRSVMGRGRENWEGSEGWKTLEGIMDGLT